MKLRRYEKLQKELFTEKEIAESRRWAMEESRAIDLKEIRHLAKLTQKELAKRLGIDQSELSRFERRRDHKLSTLARVVAAVGGSLEVVVEIGNVMYRIAPATWIDESPADATQDLAGRPRPEKNRRAAA